MANLDLLVGQSVDDIVHRNSGACASPPWPGRERDPGGEAESVSDSEHDAALTTTPKIAKKVMTFLRFKAGEDAGVLTLWILTWMFSAHLGFLPPPTGPERQRRAITQKVRSKQVGGCYLGKRLSPL